MHPHACGENVCSCSGVTGSAGSPPRVWGKRRKIAQKHTITRFTPTRVGKTRRPAGRPPDCCRFTPTRVGKTDAVRLRAQSRYGSPPRVWGKLPHLPIRRHDRRFTPTRVGKTDTVSYSWVLDFGSPPRVWGKLRCCLRGMSCKRGSPPRVWGKRCSDWHCRGKQRFTPTRVGKTTVWQSRR